MATSSTQTGGNRATSAHYPQGQAPTTEAVVSTLTAVIAQLEAAGIPYALMGGVGSATLARPRVTDDIDLFVQPEDARPVLDVLGAAGFETQEYDHHWLFKAWKQGVLVDVVFRSAGDIFFDEEMQRRTTKGVYKGQEALVLSAEDLLVIKAVVAAEYSPHHWYDALAILARCDLDWPYLVTRARQAGPRRVLSLLLYAESNDLAVPAEAIELLYKSVHP
jgi:Uncharacterised nucleotidyltransferase